MDVERRDDNERVDDYEQVGDNERVDDNARVGDYKRVGDNERVGAPADTERGALAGWVRLFACLAVLWVFVFQIAPRLQQVGVVGVLHDYVRENDIDAAAIYYTDVVEFSDADSYMRDAMAY